MQQPKSPGLEPLWWSLFGVGGAVAAYLLPIHVLVLGIAVPLGWIGPDKWTYDGVVAWLSSPLVKIYFFGLISLSLFHAAHRIRLTMEDLQLRALEPVLPFVCYGGAILLSLWTLVLVFRIG